MHVPEKGAALAIRSMLRTTGNVLKTTLLFYQTSSGVIASSSSNKKLVAQAVFSATPQHATMRATYFPQQAHTFMKPSSCRRVNVIPPSAVPHLINTRPVFSRAMCRRGATAFSLMSMMRGGSHVVQCRSFGSKSKSTQIQPVDKADGEEDEAGQEEGDPNRGYLPFRAPFHTFNIIMLLFLGNILCYLVMRFGNDRTRDFLVEHFTLSRENWTRGYPLIINAFFQENLLQLLIDCWLLSSVGNTLLSFIGNARLSWLCLLCVLGGSAFHLLKQQYFLYNGEDELVVRGRVYGPNTFIMGLIALEGLIFRHLTFVQQPPIPYLVLTAFVMALDVWRISTVMPEEHSAATGGALMALVFWALPIRFFGMDKLTAMI